MKSKPVEVLIHMSAQELIAALAPAISDAPNSSRSVFFFFIFKDSFLLITTPEHKKKLFGTLLFINYEKTALPMRVTI